MPLLWETWKPRANDNFSKLLSGNWHMASLRRKSTQSVWRSQKIFPDCCWHLFYSGVESTQSCHTGWGMFVSPHRAEYVNEWISLRGKLCNVEVDTPLPVNDTDLRPKLESTGDSACNSCRKLVIRCEGLELTNPWCFRDTSVHTLEKLSGMEGCDWSTWWCMLTLMITEDSYCNCGATTHWASWRLSSNKEICTSKPSAEILWANSHWTICASFQLRPVATGGSFRGQLTPNFVIPRKFCFKYIIKTKILLP